MVLLPLWLQQYMGYTATDAGMALAPVGVLAILLTPIVGRRGGRVGPAPHGHRRPSSSSRIVLWMRSHFNTETDFITLLMPTLIQGAAMALFFIPLTTLTLVGPDARSHSGGGRPEQLRTHHRRCHGHLDRHHLWESRAALHHAHLTEPLVQGQGVFAQRSTA